MSDLFTGTEVRLPEPTGSVLPLSVSMESGYSICMNETTTVTDLSPSSQAVLDAARSSLDWEAGYTPNAVAAAALRAAADQIAPVENELIDDCWYEKENPVRDQLLAIANELEAI